MMGFAERVIGLLTPSSNVSVERDFADWAPAGVYVHPARMMMREANLASALALAHEHAPRAAEELGTLEPDVVVFACTGAGAAIGPAAEAELVERLSRSAGAPTVSTNTAVSEAIAGHGVERIAVLTPYSDDQTEIVAAARARDGLEVVRAAGMRIAQNRDIARVDAEELLRFAEEALAGASFDLLFVSCTNLRTAPALPLLGATFGVPVVTSNRASFDAAMAILDRSVAIGAG